MATPLSPFSPLSPMAPLGPMAPVAPFVPMVPTMPTSPGRITSYTVVVVLGALAALFTAYGIGANDVANAFATSVGAKVLTMRQAIAIASVFELAGAVLLGSHVTDTIRKGIVNIDVYQNDPEALMLGMLCALIAAGTWLIIATFLKAPVSTTHSIVGAIVGFSLVYSPSKGVGWKDIGFVALSWLTSPIISGILAVLLFWTIRYFILRHKYPVKRGLFFLPFLYGLMMLILCFFIIYKGSPALKLNKLFSWWQAVLISIGIGILTVVIMRFLILPYIEKWIKKVEKEKEDGSYYTKDRTFWDKVWGKYPPTLEDKKKDEEAKKKLEESQKKKNKTNKDDTVVNMTTTKNSSESKGTSTGASTDNAADNDSDIESQMDAGDDAIVDESSEDEDSDATEVDESSADEESDHDDNDDDDDNDDADEESESDDDSNELETQSNDQMSSTKKGKKGKKQKKRTKAQIRRDKIHEEAEKFDEGAEQLFSFLQIFTATLDSFAHGANDVANSIAPFAAIWAIYTSGEVTEKADVAWWILIMGGVGIVIGLATLGYKIIKAVGDELAKVTPSRGFTMEIGPIVTVILASRVGMPVSTTHCQVGAVTAVGLLEGAGGIDWRLLGKIVFSWVVTLPVSGGISAALFAIIRAIIK